MWVRDAEVGSDPVSIRLTTGHPIEAPCQHGTVIIISYEPRPDEDKGLVGGQRLYIYSLLGVRVCAVCIRMDEEQPLNQDAYMVLIHPAVTYGVPWVN